MTIQHVQPQKPCPYDRANIFSRLWMIYLIPLFSRASKQNGLKKKDLYLCPVRHRTENSVPALQTNWDNARSGDSKKVPSFARTLLRTFGKYLLLPYTFNALSELVLQIGRPLLLSRVLRYFSDDPRIDYLDACYSAAGVCTATILIILVDYPSVQESLAVALQMKSATCGLIYQKSLKLSQSSLSSTQAGQIINLLSNDMKRIDSAVFYLVYMFIVPIQTVITVYILWIYLGFASFAGVAMLLLLIPIQAKVSKFAASFRIKIAKLTDLRLKYMNEIISGIKVIKMYCWERPFVDRVIETRKAEISQIRKSYRWKALNLSLYSSATRIILFVCFVLFIYLGNPLTAEAVFVSMALFNRLRLTLTLLFPQSIAALYELKISCKRIEKYLLLEEIDTEHRMPATEKQLAYVKSIPRYPYLRVHNLVAKWNQNETQTALNDISIDLKPGDLLAVIGPVGAGKSSLLMALLKELPLLSGRIEVEGRLSYASQQAWCFNDSVRNNILFGSEYVADKYAKVLESCALTRDLRMMPFGDQTLVGEKGVQLSGGQKARITLARAVYRSADIVLMDDPLSAVDASVAKHIFDKCIMELMKYRIKVLVTHQIQIIQQATKVLILKEGQCLAYGTYREVVEKGIDFVDLLKREEEKKVDEVDDSVKGDQSVKEVVIEELLEDKDDDKTKEGEKAVQTPREEETKHGSVSGHVYGEYIRAGIGTCMLIFFVMLVLLSQTIFHATDIFLGYWTNQNQLEAEKSKENTVRDIIIYSSLVGSMFLTMLIRDVSFFSVCMRASIELHNRIFTRLIRAPMSFFESNPAGRILNRFAKDIGNIDESIPVTASSVLSHFVQFFGVIITIGIANWILLLPGYILMVALINLRRVHLKASRDISRYDGTTRSPVYSHLTTTLDGIVSIRAFGVQTAMERAFYEYQNDNTSTLFLTLSSSNAMAIAMDLCCALFITVITAFIMWYRDMAGGTVGLIISSGLLLAGTLQIGVRTSSQFESQMTSVERVVEYQSLEQEAALKSSRKSRPSEHWPFRGEIQFDHMNLAYGDVQKKQVLKNINCTIYDGEKIGIVGRTGAGKSSLIAALFRTTEPTGSIRIDGKEIRSIGLEDLRRKISIIPQDPVIFSGTVRYNLDPFAEYPDPDLWLALESVQLKSQIDNLSGKLDAEVSENGANLSVGQRQLVCLARAILRHNRILVLDEATASVDHQTDQLIQQTIRSQFAACTVITIAHRLNTVIDCDRVMLVDGGEIKEFDSPYHLMNKQGPFYEMCLKTGPNMYAHLHELAKEAHESKMLISFNNATT